MTTASKSNKTAKKVKRTTYNTRSSTSRQQRPPDPDAAQPNVRDPETAAYLAQIVKEYQEALREGKAERPGHTKESDAQSSSNVPTRSKETRSFEPIEPGSFVRELPPALCNVFVQTCAYDLAHLYIFVGDTPIIGEGSLAREGEKTIRVGENLIRPGEIYIGCKFEGIYT